MIYITCALKCEAKPIIQHFGLKKEDTTSRFDFYATDNVRLAVTGTGQVAAAVASSCLFTAAAMIKGAMCADSGQVNDFNKCSIGRLAGIALNIGICGCNDPDIPLGTLILANKITFADSRRSYFTDILIPHHLMEDRLITCSLPVVNDGRAFGKPAFFDMEGVGFVDAANRFFETHNIYVLKIVSDHLDGKKLTNDFVSNLISEKLQDVEILLKEASCLTAADISGRVIDNEYDFTGNGKADDKGKDDDRSKGNGKNNEYDIMTLREHELLLSISANLKMTYSMRNQLNKMAIWYKSRNMDLERKLLVFNEFRSMSKKESLAKLNMMLRELKSL